MKKILSLTAIWLSVSLFLSPAAQAMERLDNKLAQPLLKQLVEQAILPMYQELDEHAQALPVSVKDFCKQPDTEGLHKVRDAWSATLSSWQQSSSLLFGPAIENEIDFTIYFQPVKKAIIKALLAKATANPDTALNPEIISRAGIGGQGLATLEYLLFDRDKDNAQMLALFAEGNAGKQRCGYLLAASGLLAGNINTIYKRWQPDGGNYAKAFYTAGQGSAQFTKTYQALELLTNKLYQAIQAVEVKKLGVPLGLRGSRSGKPRAYPYKLEAWRSGHSWQNILSSLQGMQRLFEAGGILGALRAGGDEELAGQLEAELTALLDTKLASEDLFGVLETDADSVKPFYQQIRAFANLVRTGLAPALGVQLGFNSNDGD